ncbi:hypothetical protein AMS68_002776 [Peltaster fructicola]|uniref:Apple domain-containing protein n=1 Tax=Peltaster fructicola TaxID=286661 RepID=A0A6H0XRK5_9PEZI|nr:hypothetical protein AMS68_002776 [Peltaster fructicola]
MAQQPGSLESSPEHLQRLSALYQYHNAPEVAPAHGLEYDDSNYPHSDKYPVIHSMPAYNSKWTGNGFTNDNRPPKIIFGMKLRTFLVVATIMIMVIVGAAVGGAVGGSSIKTGSSSYTPTTTESTTSSTTSASNTPTTATPSTYSAPTATYAPLSDCPAANNTLYTSSFNSGSSSSTTGLNFTRYCNYQSPLTTQNTLLSTFAYTFEDCIETCAGINFYNSNVNCQVAAFEVGASRPVNCWLGQYNTTISNLKAQSGTAVAILR